MENFCSEVRQLNLKSISFAWQMLENLTVKGKQRHFQRHLASSLLKCFCMMYLERYPMRFVFAWSARCCWYLLWFPILGHWSSCMLHKWLLRLAWIRSFWHHTFSWFTIHLTRYMQGYMTLHFKRGEMYTKNGIWVLVQFIRLFWNFRKFHSS